MNVKLIGTGAMYTKYNSACTLIDDAVMVDVPNGTTKQLLKHDFDLTKIKTILITHMHGDHIADVPFFLKQTFNYQSAKGTLKIIGPIGVKDKIFELFNAYNFESDEEINEYFDIDFIEIDEGTINVNDYSITSYNVIHGNEKPAIGYTINNKLGLTGDCGMCDGLENIFNDSNVIVCDCSHPIGDTSHTGIDNLEYLSNKYNKTIYPTHLRDYTRKYLIEKNIKNVNVVDDFYEFNL